MSTTTETRPPVGVRKALRRLRGTTATLVTAVQAARQKVATIQANGDLTHEAQARQMSEARDKLREAADQVETTGIEALAEVESAAEAKEDGSDPAAALLHENRLGRAWQRVRAQLGGGREAMEIAQEAQEASDRLVFEALREELPAWLRAHGRGTSVEAEMLMLAELEAPLRTPEEQALAEALKDARRLNELVRTNVSIVRSELETTAMLTQTAEGKGERGVVDIAPETPATGGPVEAR